MVLTPEWQEFNSAIAHETRAWEFRVRNSVEIGLPFENENYVTAGGGIDDRKLRGGLVTGGSHGLFIRPQSLYQGNWQIDSAAIERDVRSIYLPLYFPEEAARQAGETLISVGDWDLTRRVRQAPWDCGGVNGNVLPESPRSIFENFTLDF